MLIAKILLAPTFVVGASLTARRYGPKVGGLVGGLPVVAGPILLVFALSHGRVFAAEAAAGTLLGIVSLLAFIVMYAHLAGRLRWGAGLLSGWATFFVLTGALSIVTLSTDQALIAVLIAVGLTLLALPRASDPQVSARGLPVWDLPLRALSAIALVLALTALAGGLGPKLSGLLAPFPVVASVLAVFTHTQYGQQDLLRIMRGFVGGLVAYSLFFFALAISLESLGIAESFLIATTVAVTTQILALLLAMRQRPATRKIPLDVVDGAAAAAVGAEHAAPSKAPG